MCRLLVIILFLFAVRVAWKGHVRRTARSMTTDERKDVFVYEAIVTTTLSTGRSLSH
jgi:hypothetical protein